MSRPQKSRKRVSNSAVINHRRTFIKGLGALLGGAAVARLTGVPGAIESALAYVPRDNTADTEGLVFSKQQMPVIRDICDHVIPADDLPGAVDLDIHGFIDHQMHHCEPPERQSSARRVIDLLDQVAGEQDGLAFTDLAADRQRTLLEDLEAKRGPFNGDDRRDFKIIKQLVVFGYCTTEVGATQLLAWDPVPGGFRGSVPYADVGKAWFR